MKRAVIFLAGGKGVRLGSATPKQYLKLNNRPIAAYSFQLFLQEPTIEEIVVVAEETWHPLFQEWAGPTLSSRNLILHFAPPGKERQDSVYNGFCRLKTTPTCVATHDSARPFITAELIRRVFEAAEGCGAATAAMPLPFTVKQANKESGIVEKTLDRSQLFEIQTPQAIQTPLFQAGFDDLQQAGASVTDDVALIERLGKPVKLVTGEPYNLKITTAADYELANLIVAHGKL